MPAAHYFCDGVLTDSADRTTPGAALRRRQVRLHRHPGPAAWPTPADCVLWGRNADQDVAKRAGSKAAIGRRLLDSIPDWVSPTTGATKTRRSLPRTRPPSQHHGTTSASTGRVPGSSRLSRSARTQQTHPRLLPRNSINAGHRGPVPRLPGGLHHHHRGQREPPVLGCRYIDWGAQTRYNAKRPRGASRSLGFRSRPAAIKHSPVVTLTLFSIGVWGPSGPQPPEALSSSSFFSLP